ncbi:amidohydrolase family protein [Alkalimarinus alittae]|uniref:Amidohydrolase family protein n=1 Tax=Alkalimarinus alittae TaxID=2961619 RepID=A0ABY6N258_9ALTE|nr:amidohydrolase family protein [Alkalimarinus alittae]UZE96200.1 amidohydrolase family protein [Alkalimarinus alittae]
MHHLSTLSNICLVVLSAFIISSCSLFSTAPPLAIKSENTSAIIIQNADLFSGHPDEPVRVNQSILIRNGSIERVSDQEIILEGAEIIDAKGKMIIPGLIDMHVHTHGPGTPTWKMRVPDNTLVDRNLSAFLYSGVTTVFDMGAPINDIQKTVERVTEEDRVNPRIFYAGPMISKRNGHPSYMMKESFPWPASSFAISQIVGSVDDAEDIVAYIDEYKSKGSSMTKIVIDQIPLGIPSLSVEEAAVAVEHSKKLGLKVGAHIGSEADLITGMDAGVDYFVHGVYRSSISDQTIARMKAANVTIAPTLVVFSQMDRIFQDELTFNTMDKEILEVDLLESYNNRPSGLTMDDQKPEIQNYAHEVNVFKDLKFENIKRMKAAGIRILAASDSPNVANVAGSSLHDELQMLVERCGFTPAEAIAAATYLSGRYLEELNLTQGLGYIAEGAKADLLILDGDFREDINNTRKISMVITGGKVLERDSNIVKH